MFLDGFSFRGFVEDCYRKNTCRMSEFAATGAVASVAWLARRRIPAVRDWPGPMRPARMAAVRTAAPDRADRETRGRRRGQA